MLNTMKMLDAIFLTWVVKSAHLQLTHFRNRKLYHNIFMYRLAKLPVDVLAQLTVMLGMITISTTSLPTAAPASPPPKSSTLSRLSPPPSTARSPAKHSTPAASPVGHSTSASASFLDRVPDLFKVDVDLQSGEIETQVPGPPANRSEEHTCSLVVCNNHSSSLLGRVPALFLDASASENCG